MSLPWVATTILSGLVFVTGSITFQDDPAIKFADCPAAVRHTFQAEANGVKIEMVHKEKDDEGETVYWADVLIEHKSYAIGVLEDGTLTEMNLAVEDEELPLKTCPEAVRLTFGREAFDEKVETVSLDRKYGMVIYEATVEHKGKSYEIVVAEDGTLVEKVLVIDDDEVELSACPGPVKAALREHSKDGTIGDITRSVGLGEPVYEAEVEIKGKVYLVEVNATGLLISKSLHASAD